MPPFPPPHPALCWQCGAPTQVTDHPRFLVYRCPECRATVCIDKTAAVKARSEE